MRAGREHQWSALCHLCNAVPVWGMLFAGAIWFHLREESREVVGHARQAILFHGILLMVALVYMIVGFLSKILQFISAALGQTIDRMNDVIFYGLLAAYIGICLYGAVQCLHGLAFRYPLIRKHDGE